MNLGLTISWMASHHEICSPWLQMCLQSPKNSEPLLQKLFGFYRLGSVTLKLRLDFNKSRLDFIIKSKLTSDASEIEARFQ